LNFGNSGPTEQRSRAVLPGAAYAGGKGENQLMGAQGKSFSALQEIQQFVLRDSGVNYGYYGAQAGKLKNRLFWSRFKTAVRIYEKFSGQIRKGALLDLGCQFGFVSAALSREFKKVYLVELSEELLQLGVGLHQKVGRCAVVPMLNSVKDPAAYTRKIKTPIDLFLFFDVLEHMRELDKFLASIRKIGAPRSRMIISLPTENFFYLCLTRFKREPDHVNRYRDIEAKLAQQGFTRLVRQSILGLFNVYLYQVNP
jgi:2-polyprenyl-3-methyl-5-hydroxy-6-metoxy-1,4-benzoquinol methylase